MKYYGLLMVVLSCLMASVFVEGQEMFKNDFFTIAYGTMALVLFMGSKHKESMEVDFGLGLLLMLCVGFLSTYVITNMFRGTMTEQMMFKVVIIAALDYAAIGFLRLGKQIRDMERVVTDAGGRYAIG